LRQLRFGRATDDAELRARLAPGGRDHHLTQPGGSWLRFTQIAIAAGRGDPICSSTLTGVCRAWPCVAEKSLQAH
jgi:hypothetical protein